MNDTLEKTFKGLEKLISRYDRHYNNSKLIFSIIDQIPFVFWVKDENSRMVYCSRSYEDFFLIPNGFVREDYIGNTDFDIYPKEVAEKFVENDQEALKRSHPMFFKEKVTISGNNIELDFVKFPLLIEGVKYIAGQGLFTKEDYLKAIKK